MCMSRFLLPGVVLVTVLSVVVVRAARTTEPRQAAASAVSIDSDDIGGIVTGGGGPEAGVWVIAETTGLPTKFARIVVTDEQGRYLVPDLPAATYDVWVRGYGLVDSPKVQSRPGPSLALRAVAAPNARAAAAIYPAGYWFSLMHVPEAKEFPGTGPAGNGINPAIRTQPEFLRTLKNGTCLACHALGTRGTREIPAALGAFPTSTAAWERRLMSGQAGMNMIPALQSLGRERALSMFADWTDRIAAGAVPPQPPRPQGVERNVVVTLGTGPIPRRTSTIRYPRIGATLASTPTAAFTGRSS